MEKGFLTSLLDLSFTSFVTTKLIKALYVVSIILLGLTYLGIGAAALQDSPGFGAFWLLILGPLMMFFYLLLTRVWLELIMVAFRIYENTRDQLAVARAAWPEASGNLQPPRHDPPPPTPATI